MSDCPMAGAQIAGGLDDRGREHPISLLRAAYALVAGHGDGRKVPNVMEKLSPEDLYTLEAYAKLRSEFRARVMEHKKHRRVSRLGDHVVLLFEDRLTMQYQVQEMLRVERIFEEADIRGELECLQPVDSGWFELESDDDDRVSRPGRASPGARGAGGHRKPGLGAGRRSGAGRAIADEDIERSTETKTSSVHFLRFELTPAMVAALKDGAALSAGVSHATLSPIVWK